MKQNSYFGSDEKLAFGYFQRTILFSNVSKFKIAICFGGLLGFILLFILFTVALRSKPTESPTWQIHMKISDLVEAFIDSSVIFASCDYKKEDLRQMIESVKKALDFIEKNVNGIDVIDAAIGTRMLESQLRLFQLGHSKLPKSFQGALQFIQYWCKRLSETIIQRMVSLEMPIAEREHMLRNLYWVNDTTIYESPGIGNWRSDSEPKMFLRGNVTIENMLSKGSLMSEEISDNCIADVFQDCTVTDDCGKLFIEEIGSLYALTHQIFYQHFAKKKNCLNNKHFIKKMGGRSSEVLVHQMCNKVWQEAHAIEEADFPNMFIDLLLEQVTVCSLLGYTQFLKVSWLKRLFSSQGETGCFILYLKETAQKQRSTQTNILDRVKRSDNQIDTGSEECSVHFTSVALSAMGMHFRYLGDTCLRNY